MTHCDRCGRPRWDGGSELSVRTCANRGDAQCELAASLAVADSTIGNLRTRIAELEAVLVQAQRLRRAVAVHQHDYSCLPDFDNAVARVKRSP